MTRTETTLPPLLRQDDPVPAPLEETAAPSKQLIRPPCDTNAETAYALNQCGSILRLNPCTWRLAIARNAPCN